MSVSRNEMLLSLQNKFSPMDETLRKLTRDHDGFMRADPNRHSTAHQLLEGSLDLRLRQAEDLSHAIRNNKNWQDNMVRLNELNAILQVHMQNLATAVANLRGKNTQQARSAFQTHARVSFHVLNFLRDGHAAMLALLSDPNIKSFESKYRELAAFQDKLIGEPQKLENLLVAPVQAQVDQRQANAVRPRPLRLRDAITQLHDDYEQAYRDSHRNGFWRWVKNLFRKSDRVREIVFLQQVSAAQGCTDSMRLEAIQLLRAKIATETFGGGSKLSRILAQLHEQHQDKASRTPILGALLRNTSSVVEMPAALAQYAERHWNTGTTAAGKVNPNL